MNRYLFLFLLLLGYKEERRYEIMEKQINIEISQKRFSQLEDIAKWKSRQDGRTVSVEDLIRIAVDRHIERLSKKLNFER